MESLTVTRRPTRSPPSSRVSDLLAADLGAEEGAAGELVALVYDELRDLAQGFLHGERPGHAFQPTDLVHEAYARMVVQEQAPEKRSHFLALAATTMRRVLVDHARKRLAEKRGGAAERVPLSEGMRLQVEDPLQMLALDEAMTRLAVRNPRVARVVELRFLGGLSVEETAAALAVSTERVRLDWRFARAWLNRELLGGSP